MGYPLSSKSSTLHFHTSLILVGLAINAFMKSRWRQGFPLAKSVQRINNNAYAIFSLILCLSLIFVLQAEFQQKLGYIYHLSKFYEAADIYLFLLSGYFPNAHFAVHHLTTPVLTADSVIGQPVADWRIPAILNTFHHFFMYSFFGGRQQFRKILPVTGTTQLVVGIWKAGAIVMETGGERELIAVGLYLVYAVLYAKELHDVKKVWGGVTITRKGPE